MSDKATFFATMRRPEMRLLRAALWDLKWQFNVPWETITSLEVCPPIYPNDAWMLFTDHHQVICTWPHDKNPHFYVWKLHDENDPMCECSDCQDSRLCYIRCKAAYVAQPTNA